MNPDSIAGKFGFGGYLLGPAGAYGIWMNYFFREQFALEAGGAYYNGSAYPFASNFYVGGRIYATQRWHKVGNCSPYLGAMLKLWFQSSGRHDYAPYLPLGIECISPEGATVALEIAADIFTFV